MPNANKTASSAVEAERVVSVALAEVGYREKADNSGLDQPGANAGTGNWTKYARDLAAAGYYNGNKNGYAWCDVFVDWCFYMAAGKDAVLAQRVQCQTGPLGAACPYSASYYKAQGRYDKNPKKGDQAFFQEGGELVHTGIVTEVTATHIATVEGNRSDAVRKHTYSRDDSYIAGYGHPLYEAAAGQFPPPAEVPADKVKQWQSWLGVGADGVPGEKTMEAAARRMLLAMLAGHPLRQGSAGDAVKDLQGLLYAAGYDPKGLDGAYGQNTKAAVRDCQTAGKLNADGVAGVKTISALLGWPQ